MPSEDELQQFGFVGSIPETAFGTDLFNRHLEYLEQLADFFEDHGRYPIEDELADPFCD